MNKAVRLFSSGSTPGRGKAEYGGLSLQSARLGYSTVICLRLLKTPRKATHNIAFQPELATRRRKQHILLPPKKTVKGAHVHGANAG